MECIIHKDGPDETMIMTIPNILAAHEHQELQSCLAQLEYLKGFTSSGAAVQREQLWFHKDNRYFCEKWVARFPRWDAHPYPTAILKVQEKIQHLLNTTDLSIKIPEINSCLVNYYRDGNSCIQPHRDNKDSFGTSPTIVGLSIGDTRRLVLHHNNKKTRYEIKLEDNAIFIMAGASQMYFLHEIPPEPGSVAERWSLTFREHLSHIE